MSGFSGARVLVIGLGRAGVGMSKALKAAGAELTVVDQKSADASTMLDALDEVSGLDIEIITSWAGDVDWNETDLIAASPGVPRTHPALREAVGREVPVLSEVEVAYRMAKAPMLAVTGTNGKSTICALTYFILNECGKRARLCGNVAGTGLPEETVTAAAASAAPDEVLVTEVSSFHLDWVSRFRPVAATITQIVPDHLDRYDSFDEYAAAKRRIYANLRDDDVAIVNLLRPETLPPDGMGGVRLTLGERDADAVIPGEMVIFPESHVELRVSELWTGGHHNLENAAVAVLLASTQGVSPISAVEAVRRFTGLQNRMERLGEKRGVRFVNNSMCTNPRAVAASLESAPGPVLLLAGGVCKVDDLSPFEQCAKRTRQVFLYGKDAERIRSAVESAGCRPVMSDTLEEAFECAASAAQSGDTVLLSPGCSSFDQFENFIERGRRFRELVKEWPDGG